MKPKNSLPDAVEVGLVDMTGTSENFSNESTNDYAALDEIFRGINNGKAEYLRDLINYFTPKTRNKAAVNFLTEMIDKKNNNFLREPRKNIYFIFDFTEKNGLTNSFLDAFLFLLKKIPETEFSPNEILIILKKLSEFINHMQHIYNRSDANRKCIDSITDAFYSLKIKLAKNDDPQIVSRIINEIKNEVEKKEVAKEKTDWINMQFNSGSYSYLGSLFSLSYDDGDTEKNTDEIIQSARAEICRKIIYTVNEFLGDKECLLVLDSRVSFNLLDQRHQAIMVHMSTISASDFKILIDYLKQLKESSLISVHRVPLFERFHVGQTDAAKKIDQIIEALEYGYESFGKTYLASSTAPLATASATAVPG